MKILVTGATGSIGRLVVDELLALGATDIRALTTNPAKAALPPEVEVARGYLGKPETLPAAFDGVDRMYLAPLLPTVEEATRLAAAAGIGHIVDLAGAKGTDWQPIERAVEASGVPWTHLEPGEFMQNAGIWADQIRAGDTVRDGYPQSANALIAIEDIAAVAARALLDAGNQVGQVLTLTGPETLTRAEKVRQIGQALGRDLTYAELSHEETVAQLRPMMGDFATWYVQGMAYLAQHPQQVTATVAEITGRPGTTFAQWVAANVDLFR
jgi:uncharacterized protein YbjT (DUF2867 family)